MPKDLAAAFHESKMLELLNTINRLKERMKNVDDEEEKVFLKKEITDIQIYYDILSERRTLSS